MTAYRKKCRLNAIYQLETGASKIVQLHIIISVKIEQKKTLSTPKTDLRPLYFTTKSMLI